MEAIIIGVCIVLAPAIFAAALYVGLMKTRGGQSAGAWLLLALVFVLVYVSGFMFVMPHKKTLHHEQSSPPESTSARIQSTEEMWNKLTESRIQLDEGPETDPDAEPQAAPPPEWVEKAPSRVGDVYRVVVSSEPFSSVDECYAQLERRFPVEVERRLAKLVPENQRKLLEDHAPEEFGISLDYIMRDICKQEYTQTKDFSVGDMKQVFVLMEFSPEVESHLLASWQSFLRQDRLVVIAKIAALVLASLAGVYGLLYVDTMTRGYYTNRLLVGASAAIIAIAVALFVS